MFGLKPFRYLSQPIRILFMANAVVFAICFFSRTLHLDSLYSYLVGYGALVPVAYEQVWRYLTYAFIHVNFWHFAFNMFSIWMFVSLRPAEPTPSHAKWIHASMRGAASSANAGNGRWVADGGAVTAGAELRTEPGATCMTAAVPEWPAGSALRSGVAGT